MSLLAYPEYKDSGFDWLEQIPKHWGVAPLWVLFKREKITGHPTEKLLSVYRDYGIVPKESRSDNNNKPSDDLSSYQLVNDGDLVINKMKAWQGSVAISEYYGIVSPAYFVFSPKHKNNKYYINYLIRSIPYITFYLSISKGIRPNQWDLDPQYHSRMPILLPPKAEQDAIAKFLDRETGKIDALITEQEKLLVLLAEKRQATISRAVTRGLNPNAPMKDSGIALLGKVPEGWQIGKIKHFFESLDSRRIPLSAEARGNRQGEIPYYGASGIIDHIDEFIFSENLVLVSEDGANLRNRSTPISFMACGKYWVNNHAHILRPKDECLYFWSERIESIDLSGVITGSAQPKLTIDALMNLPFAAPKTFDERRHIENFIDTLTKKNNALRQTCDALLKLLKERRSALIAAAVTGKIDVRGAMAEDQAA